MRIAYVVYPDFTGLDLVGPYEVISRWPDADVHFVASSPEPVRADRGLTVIPTDTPAPCRIRISSSSRAARTRCPS